MKRSTWFVAVLIAATLTMQADPASAIIKTWRNVLPGSVNAVAVAPNPVAGNPSIIYAGTPTGVRKSLDNGVTWISVSATQTNCLAVDPLNPAVVYAAGSTGLYKSSNYGQTWTVFNPPLSLSGTPTPIRYSIVVNPFNSQVLYGDNYRSADGGLTWVAMTGFPTAVNTSLHVRASKDAIRPGFMLAAANEYSYRSDNGGVSWVTLQRDVDTVEIDPTDARYYYLGGRCGREITRFYPNSSGVIVSANVGPSHIHGLTIDPTNHARMFAYLDGGSTYTSSGFFQTYQSGSSVSIYNQGRMIFDGSNGQVLIPSGSGLMVKNSWCVDAENDGYSPAGGLCGPIDCNDLSSALNPGVLENCLDGLDNNCNDLVDMADARCITLCSDKDLDGHTAIGCPGGDDCNDNAATIYPGAPELCDWRDNNCNGQYDEGFDQDGDGVTSCSGDCDDNNPAVSPYAPEICDGIDNNCDGIVDERCPLPMLAWGDNSKGQIGDGTTTDRKTPVTVSNFLAWNISAGYTHSLATPDGTVWAWGDNAKGQLGDGTLTGRKTPVQVLNVEGMGGGYLEGVDTVAGGLGHSLALMQDGTVYAWGDNDKGQIGDGTKLTRKQPVPVLYFGYAEAIAAGAKHSMALYYGSVLTWGDNTKSQLGDGSSVNRSTPVYVDGIWNYVTAIAAGSCHSLALTSDGLVWAWGDNSKGQLGDGTLTPRKTPVQVAGLYNVVSIAAGYYHSMALTSDGTVWVWGDNAKGQIGDGTTTLRRLPTAVKGLSGVTAIAAGSYHNLALDATGVKAWGLNSDGQLGDGSTTTRKTPVAVPGTAGVTVLSAGAAHSLARQ